MNVWRQALAAVAALAVSISASAATIALGPGANITQAVENANPGDTITLAPGDYNATNTGAFVFTGSFGIAKRVTIRGLGATPADVRLHGSAEHVVLFLRYPQPPIGATYGDPNGARLENLSICGPGAGSCPPTAPGGVLIQDFVPLPTPVLRFADIVLKDVVINTNTPGNGFGVLVKNSDRIILDTLTITSYQAGINLINVTDSLVINSTVNSTSGPQAPALAVQGGSGNQIVGNTFGQPKANPAVDSGYSFQAGNTVFYNTLANRFENNTLQGHRDDGLDFTAINLPGVLPSPQDVQNPRDNYAAKNRVISSGFAANLPGGSGIWSNCGNHNMWLYANETRGSRECGICVWTSNSNMLLGNRLYDHGINGIFISGGTETTATGDCAANGGAYAQRPTNNFLRNNYVYFNREDQILVRTADTTDVSLNITSKTNGRGGAEQVATGGVGQGAWFIQTPGAAPVSNGFRLVGNSSLGNMRGIFDDDGKNDPGLEFFLNRIIGSQFNRWTSTGINIDGGPQIGGNYWAGLVAATANPSSSPPYAGVLADQANTVGPVVDRYPFKSEDFGRGYGIQVFEPFAGWIVARGTLRTVRWNAPGCVYMDITLDGGTVLANEIGNTGYAVVQIPDAASIGNHVFTLTCKDSAGNVRSTANSPTFTVGDGALKLLAPGRDDVFNANTDIFVAWKRTAAVGTVDIQISLNGGASFSNATLSAGGAATGLSGNHARIRLPVTAAVQNAVLRVVSGATYRDTTDGVFAIRGSSGAAFTNVPPGRQFVMGNVERLEWASPLNSRLVTITANGTPVATKLPDRGYFDWIPGNLGVVGVTLSMTFYDSLGTTNLGTVNNANGVTRYPTTITFGPASTIPAGSSQSITSITNSGQPTTLVTLTPSICSVSGTTVNALANGTCTVQATAGATGSFAASSPATLSFTVATIASVTRLSGISTRARVLTGDNIMIGGFIIGGSTPKKVIIYARGPSLVAQGIAEAMTDPVLTLVQGATVIATNDNWQHAANWPEVQSLGLQPSNILESAILTTLAPGAYTALVSGLNGTTGIGIVEVYEVDGPTIPLVGISTRGVVQTGDGVMIAGFIISGTTPQTVVVKASGPSIGVPGFLADPTLTIVQGATVIATNDNWQTHPNAATLQASGGNPGNPLESAILITLNPGAYTAILSGVNGSTGVGLIEVYGQ